MEKRCLAVRHVTFEGLGVLAPLLHERGYNTCYVDAAAGELSREIWLNTDLIIVLGGPRSVYEADRYPFLAEEIEGVRARLEAGKPLLGICLGAQIMAAALGATVSASGSREIGWKQVELTQEGRKSCLSAIEGVPIPHWHGDNCCLPEGCTLLAHNSFCPVQAYTRAPYQLGLQFHLEAKPEWIERWFVNHAGDLDIAGHTEDDIRGQAKEYGARSFEIGRQVFSTWLDHVEQANA